MRLQIIGAMLVASLFAYTARADEPMAAPPDAPPGWIALEENFWIPLTQTPGSFFHWAHEEFLRKDFETSAMDLRQAAAFLRLQARRSTNPEHANPLYAEAYRLTDLARQVEQKDVKAVSRLDREFARAHAALAEHDYAMARESWKKKLPRTTGYNLDAAAFNLKAAYAWAHEEPGPAGFTATADADSMGERLIKGEAPRKYEITTTMDAVHSAVQSLAKVIDKMPEEGGPLKTLRNEVAAAPKFLRGWILVEENIWRDLPDNSGRHLQDAYEAFLLDRSKRAATELREAVFDLQLQAGRATGDDKTALMDSIHDLHKLLVPGDPDRANLALSYEQYERALAKACYAMARHRCERAESEYAMKSMNRTGRDLEAAVNYFDRGRIWAGQVRDEVADRELRDARNLSEKLITGTAKDEKNVEQRI
ncbi:MAG TPA: hypothetical protein VMV94_12705, partial [Phycisphaerae bacterium]|nr:hypothetical protein [Phycisphaerae bacterium]